MDDHIRSIGAWRRFSVGRMPADGRVDFDLESSRSLNSFRMMSAVVARGGTVSSERFVMVAVVISRDLVVHPAVPGCWCDDASWADVDVVVVVGAEE